jgi:single-strand DNA-binding protein
MNKIMLIGNLGKDPDMSYTDGGMAVTKFSLAVSRRTGKSKTGERNEITDWFNITAFGNLAETCNTYLKKGQKVFIEGRLQPREYTSKDGAMRTSLDVVISEMEMLTPKDRQQGSGSDYLRDEDPLGDLDDHPF